MMDDPRALEALLAAARDESERTRAAAMRSLGQCVGDLRASAYLLKGLGDPDGWVRYYACQALGKMAFEPAADAIVRLLEDAVGQVRVAAVEALSCLSGERAVKALETAAVDHDGDIRRSAIVGLGVARRQEALPLILEAARAADSATRLVALSALASFRSPEVVEAFRRAAADTDESVRTAAIGFLAAMTGPTATRVLVELLRVVPTPEPVLAALSLHVDGRVPGLVAALQDADEQLAPPVASALTRMRRPDATAALVGAMDLPSVAARKAAASALAVISGPDALAVLARAAREDPELEVRQICSLLLAR
jgi:HEAT repeat protein